MRVRNSLYQENYGVDFEDFFTPGENPHAEINMQVGKVFVTYKDGTITFFDGLSSCKAMKLCYIRQFKW